MIVYVANRMARVCIEDAMEYAHQRRVFGKRLIDSEVIRAKFGKLTAAVDLYRRLSRSESQGTWSEWSSRSRPGSNQ